MTRDPRYEEAADLLSAHLVTLPDRPPTVWENQEKDPTKWPNANLLILAAVNFNTPWLRTHSGGHIITGFLGVTILARENTYTSAGKKLVDNISRHFPFSLQLGKVRITSVPSMGPAYNNPPYWRCPVLIPFRYLT